ncbi:MAG: hypothetical protein Q9203_006799 [Teloschistes exilis]
MTGAAKGDEAGAPPSPIPLLGEGFSDSKARSTPEAADGVPESEPLDSPEIDPKTGKRRFWVLSKKKDDGKAKGHREAAVTSQPAPGIQSISPLNSPKRTTIMASPPIPTSHPYGTPASTGRNISSGSPHIPSPALSQIFERNVQEDGLASTASPAQDW